MFEYSFVPTGKTSRPLYAAFACVGETVLLGVLILVPLWFYQVLPPHDLYRAILLAPVPSAPPPPPPPIIVAAPKVVKAAAPRPFNPEALVTPVHIPKAVTVIEDAPVLEMAAVTGGVPGGLPAGIPGGAISALPGLVTAPPPPPPPPPAPAVVATVTPPPTPGIPKRITVGGEVEAAMLLEQQPPEYPMLARQARDRKSTRLNSSH